MEKRFAKDTDEWMLFTDFWKLCQKYWIPEDRDEWWNEALKAIDEFVKKHNKTSFAKGLALVLIQELEIKHVSK